MASSSQQRHGMQQLTHDLVSAIEENGGQLPGDINIALWLAGRTRQYGMRADLNLLVLDDRGNFVTQHWSHDVAGEADWPALLSPLISDDSSEFISLTLGNTTMYATAQRLTGTTPTSHVLVLLMPKQHFWDFVTSTDGRRWRYALLITVISSGWIVFFWLTRRMTRPIAEAVSTATRIASGEYDVQLNTDQAEKELHELMMSFQEMADRLKHLESLRTQLIASVTHEIRTPVTAVHALIQAIKDGVVSGPDINEYLDLSLMETKRLESLVEDLLEYSRYKGTAIPVDRREIDLCNTVDAIVRRWEQRSLADPSAGVHVTFLTNVQSLVINTDPLRVEQILINLLNNAQEAMSNGGVIQVKVTETPDRCAIQVQDSGNGISSDQQDEIFELFYSHKKGARRGLGLGLPFSRLIAHSLGGTLTLDWSGPQGTSFTLTLPR